MYYLTDFKHFFYQFSFHFRSNWPPFPLILNLLTPHFYKSLDPIGSFFFSCVVPGYRIFDEVPPPGILHLPLICHALIMHHIWWYLDTPVKYNLATSTNILLTFMAVVTQLYHFITLMKCNFTILPGLKE